MGVLSEPARKGVPEHEGIRLRKSRIPVPNETESNSAKAVRNRLLASRKAPSAAQRAASAVSGTTLGNMGLFCPERVGSDKAGKSRLSTTQETR